MYPKVKKIFQMQIDRNSLSLIGDSLVKSMSKCTYDRRFFLLIPRPIATILEVSMSCLGIADGK